MVRTRVASFRALALSSCAALALSIGAAGSASADAPRDTAVQSVQFQIPVQSLSSALSEFARQSGRQLLFAPDIVAGKSANAVVGALDPLTAFDRLIAGSGLTYSLTASGAILLRDPARASAATSAAADQPAAGGEPAVPATDQKVEKVTVTGTRIRGAKDQFSPVTKITRDQMDRAGQANVSDLLNTLPQNFGGGFTPDTLTAGSSAGSGGATANLRGLGNEATLILVNGRRLAPGGLIGNFIDLSTIPTSAIERVEVLSDGASAIYGTDAIAGVVNIILRDDFDGAETRLNLSQITDSGSSTLKAAQTVGFNDGRAHGLLSYEYSTEDELNANDKDFARSAVDPTYLIPFNQKHSVLGSGGVSLSDRVSLSGDAFFNQRKTKGFTSDNLFGLLQRYQQVDVEQVGFAGGLDVDLFDDWHGELSASFSKSSQFGDYLNIGASGGTLDSSQSEIGSADISTGGPLFNVTDEPVRLLVGAHHRYESIDQLSTDRAGVATFWNVENDRHVSSIFGEVYAPLVSQIDEVAGINRLALTIAARYDDYSDVGSSLDPKVGVLWSPVQALNFRGTWGTAFRVPRLDQLSDKIAAALLGLYVDPDSPTGTSVALLVNGETSDLKPEEAEVWTAGLDLTPDWISGLRARTTYFSVDYTGRIARPSFQLDGSFRFVNFTGPILRDPSFATVQGFVDVAQSYGSFFDFFPFLGSHVLSDTTVILDQRTQNLSASKVEGVDLEFAYDITTDFGDWSFLLNSTILTTFTQQPSPVSPERDLLNTFGNPVDVRVRGGIVWQQDAVTAAAFANYVDSYTDDQAASGPFAIDSWTTIDASLRIELEQVFGDGIAKGALITLSVTNLFNEDPPAIGVAPFRSLTYDAANADPTGRRVGILLSKQW